MRAAMSGIGLRRAWRAISRSPGMSSFIAPLSLLEARKHLAPPSLRRPDLVESENVQTRDAQLRPRQVWPKSADEPPRLITAWPEHPGDPARMAAQESRGIGDADLRRHAQQPRRVCHARHADVDRKAHAAMTHALHPSPHRLGVEAHVAHDVGREAALVPHRLDGHVVVDEWMALRVTGDADVGEPVVGW